jgi:hypothetical protein
MREGKNMGIMTTFKKPTLESPPAAPPRGTVSDLWRSHARRHAALDLSPRLCRYRLSVMPLP